jgi:hypothetical protein
MIELTNLSIRTSRSLNPRDPHLSLEVLDHRARVLGEIELTADQLGLLLVGHGLKGVSLRVMPWAQSLAEEQVSGQ